MNNDSVKKQILFIINKYLMKVKDKKKFLIDCLDSNGYTYVKTVNTEEEEFVTFNEIYNKNYQINQTELTFKEKEHTSIDTYGFNRTFINPSSDSGAKRLLEVQKRGITPEEIDFIKVSNMIDIALNQLNIDNEAVKNTALNMYLNIISFYKYQETIEKKYKLVKGYNKGSVKSGYIVLVLYYSLVNYYICVPRDKLVSYFTDISSRDLPLADRNIKTIFENVKGYEFIYKGINERCLCNMRNLINTYDKEYVTKINQVIVHFQKAGVFNTPALNVQVGASIYYVLKEHINLKVVSNYCGISEDTLRKTILLIK